MSGQQIGTVVGGIVGAYFGYPQLGMAIGGLIGGAVDPEKIHGPHIGQGQVQTASPGVPIAWVQGTAKVAGTLMVVGPRREVQLQDSGKGGPEVFHYETRQDFAILICESSELRNSTIKSVIMVEQDGKLVYDARPNSKIAAASAKWKANVDFLFGAEDQLPHPTLEMISGVGSTPAYRGRCIAVFKDFNTTMAGERIPQFKFTVSSATEDALVDNVLEDYTLQLTIGSSQQVKDQNNLWYYTKAWSSISAEGSPFISDFLISDGGTIQEWAWGRYGFKLQPYGRVDSEIVWKSGMDSASMVGILAIDGALDYDTGWHWQSGPPTPDFINDWFTLHGLNHPITSENDITYPLPVDVAPGIYQSIRLHHFQYPGAYDALDYRPTVKLALTGNRPLRPLEGTIGYWEDTSDGSLWRPSWVAAAPELVQRPLSTTLQTIAQRICERGGLTDDQIDVAALAGIDVAGYAIATQCTGDQALAPLLQAYFAFATECDASLLFKFYGEDALQTVSRDDLIITDATNGAISETKRNQATEFPQKVVAAFIDPDQNYDTNTVTAERLAQTVVAIGETDIQIPVAMDADQAAQAADKALKIAYATLEGTRDYSVPYATPNANYLTICAGEPVLMDGKRWVTDAATLSNGSIKFETRYDRQSAYTSNVQAVKPNPPATPTSSYSGPTILLPMNLPSLRPQDTYGLYLAAKGYDTNWRGCVVQISYDDQVSWQNALTINAASTMGALVEDETGTGTTTVDIGTTASLESVTDAQLDAKANAYAVVDSDGIAEVRQFKTAALQESGTDAGDWLLSDQRTGLLGTTHKDYLAGDQFTMLASVYFFPIDPGFAGKTLYLRGVGFGEAAEDATIIPFVFEAFQPRDLTIYGRVTTDGSARVDTSNEWRILS